MKCLALAIFAGALIAECANAHNPGGVSAPQALPTPHVPRPPSVSAPSGVPGVDAAKSAVRDAVEFGTVKAKVRAKNPNATEEQVEAGTKTVIKRRRENQEALKKSKDQQELFEKQLDKMRTEKESNTVRAGENDIVGFRPQSFDPWNMSSRPRPARQEHFDEIVLTPGFFIWAK